MRAISFPSTLVLLSLSSQALSAPGAMAQSEAGAPTFAQETVLPAPAGQPAPERARQSLARLQIPFIANESRIDPRVSHYASTFAGTVYVTKDGTIVYSLQGPDKKASARVGNKNRTGWSLTETLIGGKVRPRGDGLTPTRASYFIGNDPARWKTELATYGAVSLGKVWPGVDVRLRAYGRNTEKLFTVHPGANPDRIRMRVCGARSLQVDAVGALVATTGLGKVTFTPPVAYQELAGVRREVEVAYDARGDHYGFRLGKYDSALPVVIDPLLQATYLGGGLGDDAEAIAIDPTTGDVFVTGMTDSADFPGTAGGAQPTSACCGASFVARLDATLTTIIQATYLGVDEAFTGAFAIAINPTTDEVFVAGETSSENFPGTAGGAQPFQGSNDAFVARFNTALTALKQATYLGGSVVDSARALTIDPTTNEVIVAGATNSPDFLGTTGGAQPAFGGGAPSMGDPDSGDAFVARLNGDLTKLNQATYLGGGDSDIGYAVAVHQMTGEVLVGGTTSSANFPGTAGGAQPAMSGDFRDGFVARLSSDLSRLNQATYLGGSRAEDERALAIHPSIGEVFVAGRTLSPDFPGTVGGAQPAFGGGSDVFVARLNADLTSLNQSTYVGGTDAEDFAGGLAIAPTTGNVFVAGLTYSGDLPGTFGGARPIFRGNGDAFVARLNGPLSTLIQATYLGGRGLDGPQASIAVHPDTGDVSVAGRTCSVDFPETGGGAQPRYGGFCDAFVARLTSHGA